MEFVSPFFFGDFGPTLQCEHLNSYYTSRSVSINDMFFRHLLQKKVATPDLCRRSLLFFLFDVHPWAPTTHGKMKVLVSKTMGEITPKNEGWGGSHGRKYIESMPCMISCNYKFLGVSSLQNKMHPPRSLVLLAIATCPRVVLCASEVSRRAVTKW